MKNQKLNEYCNNIRNQYKDYLSLEQFRIICKIAKRTANYLLTNGVVPCIDTGKQTCRFKIKIDDVLAYLHSLESVERITATGMSSCKVVRPKVLRESYSAFLKEIPESGFLSYLEQTYHQYPDVITPSDIAEITGLVEGTIQHYTRNGHIQAFRIGRNHMIPKPYAYEFIMSDKFIDSLSPIEYIVKISHELEAWLEVNPVDCEVVL